MSREGLVRGYFETEAEDINLTPAKVTTTTNEAWYNIFRREVAYVALKRLRVGEARVYCGMTLMRPTIGIWTLEYLENDRPQVVSRTSIRRLLDFMFRDVSPSKGSRYKGVYPNKNGWTAVITYEGKFTYLGYRKTEEEAAQLYNDFVIANKLSRELNEIEAGV